MLDSLSAGIARWGAPAFRVLYRYDRALRRKLTPAGWLLAALGVVAAVFGVNTNEVPVYQLLGLVIGLFVVAAVASWRLRLQLSATRRLPQQATAGVPFDYTLSLRFGAAGALPSTTSLWVEDLLAPGPLDERAFARGFPAYKVSADRGRNAFDRLVGYPRWVAYLRQHIGARIDAVPIGSQASDADPREHRVTLRCLPLRRGVLRFEAVRLARVEPLGLLRAHQRWELHDRLLVLPRTHPVAALQMPGSRRLQPGGVALAGRIGEAEEFVGLRDYRPGDTPRRIHWKAWARSGRPVVKEHQDEFFVRHALVLDTFGAVGVEAFETAVSLAASMVVMPRSNDSLLDLMFVETRAYTLTQGRGVGAAAELLRVLAAVSPAPAGASFTPLAEAVALGAARISSAICVLLAWDEPRQRMVAGLRQRGLPLRVWVVREDGPSAAAEGASLAPGPMASDPSNLRVVSALTLAQALMQP